MAINKVIFIGRLTANPEIKHIKESTVVNFALAQNKIGKAEESNFLSCTAWNKNAIAMHKYLQKGSLVGIVGRHQSNNYVDKDGNNRTNSVCIIEQIDFLESKKINIKENTLKDMDFTNDI